MAEGNDRSDQEEVMNLLAKVPRPSSGDWKDIFNNAVTFSKEKYAELEEKYSQ